MPQISLAEFADRMDEIMPAIIKGFARRQLNELYKGKITMPQFLILDFLNKARESRMTDLAKFMKVTTAAMTGLVDRLVRDGYAARGPDLKDRRIIKIKLNPSGNELVRKINAQRREMIIKIFGKISSSDREDYLRILKQIKEILAKEEEEER
jgi:DNA-binding MarR family transcriptional regulator